MVDYHLPDEPSRFTSEHLNRILIHSYRLASSDITIQTSECIWVTIQGHLFPITKRRLSNTEVTELLHHIYGPNGNAQILSGRDINTHYECRFDRRTRYRFRVNVTGCLVDGHEGIQISLRSIATTPPTLDTLHLEPELLSGLTPENGIVYVTGPTGSGKSTLLAAIIRNIAESRHSHRKILTYESPIEYVYDEIDKLNAIVSQVEIPRHLPSFSKGIENALRRNPQLILIGEAPDAETIKAVIEAGLTGHPVYTTLHSNGVVETVRRLMNALQTKEQSNPLIDILETIRVIVWQRLLPTTDNQRVPLREFLVFDEAVRTQLLETPENEITNTVRLLLHTKGQPIGLDAEKKFKAGIISLKTFQRFQQSH